MGLKMRLSTSCTKRHEIPANLIIMPANLITSRKINTSLARPTQHVLYRIFAALYLHQNKVQCFLHLYMMDH